MPAFYHQTVAREDGVRHRTSGNANEVKEKYAINKSAPKHRRTNAIPTMTGFLRIRLPEEGFRN